MRWSWRRCIGSWRIWTSAEIAKRVEYIQDFCIKPENSLRLPKQEIRVLIAASVGKEHLHRPQDFSTFSTFLSTEDPEAARWPASGSLRYLFLGSHSLNSMAPSTSTEPSTPNTPSGSRSTSADSSTADTGSR